MKTFVQFYHEAYPNNPFPSDEGGSKDGSRDGNKDKGQGRIQNQKTYGRRKWKVLRSMTKKDLIQSFKDNPYFGNQIRSQMSKSDILTVLKRHTQLI